MITIRREQRRGEDAIRAVNEKAFGQPPDGLSLAAVSGRQIVGHNLFTPVVLQTAHETHGGMGLAPMAVLPEHQHQGIGRRLLLAAEDWGRERDAEYASLEYLAPNTRASIFYQRSGYRAASMMAVKLL